MPPRKDFVPFSKKDQAGYGRQSGVDFPPTTGTPQSPPSFPHQLTHIVDDFSDTYVYLTTALKKIADCCKNNPSITEEQKKALAEIYFEGKKALKVILKIGNVIEDVANIAGQPTPDASVPRNRKVLKRN